MIGIGQEYLKRIRSSTVHPGFEDCSVSRGWEHLGVNSNRKGCITKIRVLNMRQALPRLRC